jgi:hypothetical protein
MALVGHGRRPEQALQSLKVQLVRSKLVEDDGDVLEVLPPRRTIDENVIKENQHKSPQVRAHDVVHQGLERCRGVGEPKRHDQELVLAVVSVERCLIDVVRELAHLVVAGTQVQLGEESGTM